MGQRDTGSDQEWHFLSSYFQRYPLSLTIKMLADEGREVLNQKPSSENFYVLSKGSEVQLGLRFSQFFHKITINPNVILCLISGKISLEMINMLHCKWHHLTICRLDLFKLCVKDCTYSRNPFYQPVLFGWMKTSDFYWH